MAHQARADILGQIGDRLLEKRPELAKLLGVLCGQWSWLECNMSWLCSMLLGKYTPHNQRKGPPTHPLGIQIFEALPNIHSRLELLQGLAGNLIPPDHKLTKELKDTVLPSIKRAATRRNHFIHTWWSLSKEYPDALLRGSSTADIWMVYEASDFREAINLIVNASHTVSKFTIKVRKFLRGRKRPK